MALPWLMFFQIYHGVSNSAVRADHQSLQIARFSPHPDCTPRIFVYRQSGKFWGIGPAHTNDPTNGSRVSDCNRGVILTDQRAARA